MNGYVPLLGLLGLGLGAGVLVLLRAWRTPDTPAKPPQARKSRRAHAGRWAAASAAGGLLAAVLTGWIVGGLLAALAVWWLPRMLGADGTRERTARIEGIAGWTEMLRDTLAAAAGLEQTIVATAPTAPEAVQPQVLDLAARLESGERLPNALRQLAQDLGDPTADLVIAALVLASGHEARRTSPLLGELAATARAQVEMHQRIDANRARTRTTTRVVVGTTLFFSGGLIVLNPAFLSPYDTATGQLVLLMIGGLFSAGFAWLHRMAHFDAPERFFTALDTVSATEREMS